MSLDDRRAPARRSPLGNKRLARAALLGAIASIVVSSFASSASASVSCTAGQWCHAYAGQFDTAISRLGIDGYVNASASTGLPSTEGMAYWLGLDSKSPPDAQGLPFWAQSGQFQGTAWAFLQGGGGSLTQVRQYWENRESCGYHGGDLGVPARANYAYYVTRTTSTTTVCGGSGTGVSEYIGYVRIGSFTNPPVATVYFPIGYSTFPETETEFISSSGLLPGIHPAYFGLNDSHAVSASYSMHLQTSTTWQSWTVANTGQAPGKNSDSPPYYHGLGGASDYSQYYAGSS